MNVVATYFRTLARAALDGWNRFWFTPSDAATLAVIRIAAGAMLFYTHFVWGLGYADFLAADSLIPRETFDVFYGPEIRPYAFTHLWLVQSPTAFWTAHVAALVVLAMFTAGLFTRVTSVLAWLITLSYVHRLPLVVFGTDQTNTMLAMYLMLGPAGDAYSLDRWIAGRRAGGPLPNAAPTTTANIAIRLIQLHMCVVYFFAGLGKLQGDSWWGGGALWGAVANYEYQTVDLTWLADFPVIIALLTQATAYWELFFCVLVWPRLLRPLVIFIALPLHWSIGICMGLMTFGLIMPVGVYAFVPPEWTRRLIEGRQLPQEQGGAGEGSVTPVATTKKATRNTRRAS